MRRSSGERGYFVKKQTEREKQIEIFFQGGGETCGTMKQEGEEKVKETGRAGGREGGDVEGRVDWDGGGREGTFVVWLEPQPEASTLWSRPDLDSWERT